jgi:predicted dehydrogenase
MPEKVRVGVLGMSHDHVWGNLKNLVESEDGELVAAADPNPALRNQFQQTFGSRQVFEDPAEMLDKLALDAVYVFGDNAGGVDLAVMAAERGLHIMIEKPMAATYAGAARMRGAARQAGVQLMINWPFIWMPALQHALRMVANGELGEIFQVNYRSAHGGPRELGCSPYFSEWLYDPKRNGAGALMDYCCYGAVLACTVLGLPSSVTAVSGRLSKHDLPAEDNAVIIMQHPAAISVATASWTQSGHLTSYEPMFYGSQGTIVIRTGGHEMWLANSQNDGGVKLDIPDPAPEMRNSATYFLSHIRSGEPITGMCSPEVSLMAQQVLEAGIISAAEGNVVRLPLPMTRLRA